MSMKLHLKRLLGTLATLAAAFSTASATLPYSNGDLLLGVRATAEPGSTKDYVINLGSATQFTQAIAPFTVGGLGNLAADLGFYSDSQGDAWHQRGDVFWSVIGTDLPGDPANTLYVSRPRSSAGVQSAPWDRRTNTTQSIANSTFRAYKSGYTQSPANAQSAKGTFQDITAQNHYGSFTVGATDFGAYEGVEATFDAGAASSVLDLYRLTPTTNNPAGQGLLYVGAFTFNTDGSLTFTPTAPTTPFFKFSAANYNVVENQGQVSITVTRGGVLTGADTVQFDTSNGSAAAGTDYTAKNSFVVNFAPTETQAAVTVQVQEVAGIQADRVFNIALSNPSAGFLATPSSSTVTITESTPQNFGQIAFTAATFSAPPVNGQAQPNQVALTLTRTNGSDGVVSVDVTTAAGGSLTAPGDFTGLPATVQFGAGETSKTVLLQLTALADSKLPGTINVALTNAQGGVALGATATATVTITARDAVKPTLTLSTKSGKVSSSAFQIAGSAKDNVGIDRVEVRVSGGPILNATLQPAANGSRAFDLTGITLENGKNTIEVTGYDASGNATKKSVLKVTYTNVRPELAGIYTGLIVANGAATNNNTGLLSIKVTPTGTFTGKATVGTANLAVRGIIANDGDAHFNVVGDTALAPDNVSLSSKKGSVVTNYGALDFSLAANVLTGALADGANLLATIDGDRAAFDGKTPATTVAANYLVNKGGYTIVFPAPSSVEAGLPETAYPQGDGIGTVKLTNKGIATLKGTLADGTKVTASAPVSSTYEWPILAKLYTKAGAVAVKTRFDDTQANSDLSGTGGVWIRPAIATAKHYPNGWPTGIPVEAIGAKYNPAPGGSVLIGLPAENLTTGNADLRAFAGNLTATVTKGVNISPTNKVTNAPADTSFSVKITPASGLVSGKFPHTDNTSPKFSAVILQKGSNAGGFGFFLSTVPNGGPSGQSGAVTLLPRE